MSDCLNGDGPVSCPQELKEMRRAGVRTFTEAEVYEADRKRRALEERGARGDRLHARHPLRSDADDAAILAQVGPFLLPF